MKKHSAWLFLVMALIACDNGQITQASRRNVALTPDLGGRVIGPPPDDATMGDLSGIARHVAAGLQNPTARLALREAMLESSAYGVGADLQDCASDRPVGLILAAGAAAGGEAATAVCARLRGEHGVVLYMDPDRLHRWDGTTIPIVTAIADLQRPLPTTFNGFLSPGRMITLPRDGSLAGPILVVLRIPHPRRFERAIPPLPPANVTHPAAPPQH